MSCIGVQRNGMARTSFALIHLSHARAYHWYDKKGGRIITRCSCLYLERFQVRSRMVEED